ncbi:hypothetical protein G7046_g6159 [Stylonectria norvegica]|nr:hypothetical protein G7046_g6159 [Stylonectria norvegica]
MAQFGMFPGVAVVTGAAGTGIGAGVAKAFARAGCKRIAITDLNAELLENTRVFITDTYPQVEVYAEAGNIANVEFTDSFFQSVGAKFGRVDYAVNCAGIMGNNQRSTETSPEEFDHINGVNYRGCWLSSRAELQQMLQQEALPSHDPARPAQRGSIVNIASQLALVGRPCAPAYSGSKAAVIALTRGDAIDYAGDKIRVNCICPGIIETPMTVCDEERIRLLKPAIEIAPLQRMGKVDEVADCALFLCSTQASFVHRHAMIVDGGYVIN